MARYAYCRAVAAQWWPFASVYRLQCLQGSVTGPSRLSANTQVWQLPRALQLQDVIRQASCRCSKWAPVSQFMGRQGGLTGNTAGDGSYWFESSPCNYPRHGVIAQLGERLLCTQKVSSSILLSSTRGCLLCSLAHSCTWKPRVVPFLLFSGVVNTGSEGWPGLWDGCIASVPYF